MHNLELIGSCVKELPPGLLTEFPQIPWSSIARMRDRLAHHYLGVDLEIVWAVVGRDLPPLHEAVMALMQTLDDIRE